MEKPFEHSVHLRFGSTLTCLCGTISPDFMVVNAMSNYPKNSLSRAALGRAGCASSQYRPLSKASVRDVYLLFFVTERHNYHIKCGPEESAV